ncbi:Diaminopimelate epimerase-like protein [Auriscalpium vulgare]|uniref:Diaminopimelate epimerase-like protein n=1 Tax=Auriscalpium vulgare TaxID=40419 RepID=A0ACB8RE12_9AGAM|nr:Diaminopimelate epimerase-like protein [Auriscalpium vulgare]
MAAETQNILPVTILNAFTDDFAGGNPAACVFLTPALSTSISSATLQAIAENLNQPVTAFIAPLSANASSQTLRVRFFTSEEELPLCGHATLASAGALFADDARVPAGVQELRFETTRGDVMVAKRAPEGRMEIALVRAALTELEGAEADELREVLAHVLGNTPVVYMGKADAPYGVHVLVEVDTLHLGELELNLPALLDTKFLVNILTARSAEPGVAFESRMFHGTTHTLEDAVCGSAHALLAPYWAAKDALGPAFLAKQASARGGYLQVGLEDAEGLVKIAGNVRKVLQGQLYV